MSEQQPSLIQSLLPGVRRKDDDDAAERELDLALVRLSRAFDENGANLRRRSSGNLKIVALPEAGSGIE